MTLPCLVYQNDMTKFDVIFIAQEYGFFKL